QDLVLLLAQLLDPPWDISNPLLHDFDLLKLLVPTGFQFGHHQAVFWFGAIVLSEGPLRFILSLLQLEGQKAELLVGSLIHMFQGLKGRFDRYGPDDLKDFPANRLIHAQASKGEAIGTALLGAVSRTGVRDRKSTRLNSSHQIISYAVFCLK